MNQDDAPWVASDWCAAEMKKLSEAAARWRWWRWLPWSGLVQRRLERRALNLSILLDVSRRHEQFKEDGA